MYRAVHHLRQAVDAGFDGLVALVECVGFWCSIALPFFHVPLIVALGLTETTAPALAALWSLNALALVVGARHTPAASHGPFAERS